MHENISDIRTIANDNHGNPDVVIAFDGEKFTAYCQGSLQGINVSEQTVKRAYPEYKDATLYLADYHRQAFPGQGVWSLNEEHCIERLKSTWNDVQSQYTDWVRKHRPNADVVVRFEDIIFSLDRIIVAPKDKSEYANILLILMHEALEHGISMDDLLDASYKKLTTYVRRSDRST